VWGGVERPGSGGSPPAAATGREEGSRSGGSTPAPSPVAMAAATAPPGCGISHSGNWDVAGDCKDLAPGGMANNHGGF
jgi:hypothetical protein